MTKKNWRSTRKQLTGEELLWAIVAGAESGLSITELAKDCGYSRSTFYNWLDNDQEKYDEFKEAMDWADTLRAAYWMAEYRAASKDKSKDANLISKMCHNIARKEFSEKQEIEHSADTDLLAFMQRVAERGRGLPGSD